MVTDLFVKMWILPGMCEPYDVTKLDSRQKSNPILDSWFSKVFYNLLIGLDTAGAVSLICLTRDINPVNAGSWLVNRCHVSEKWLLTFQKYPSLPIR